MDNINAILKQGHNVVVHINDYYANPGDGSGFIFLYEAVLDLLKRSDIDSYFVKCDGLNAYMTAHYFVPIMVRCHMVSKQDLFGDDLPKDVDYCLAVIARFFGYKDFKKVVLS